MKSYENRTQLRQRQAADAAAGRAGGYKLVAFPKEFERDFWHSLDHRFLAILLSTWLLVYGVMALLAAREPAAPKGINEELIKKFARNVLNIEPEPEEEEFVEEEDTDVASSFKEAASKGPLSKEARDARKEAAKERAAARKSASEKAAAGKGVLGVLAAAGGKGSGAYADVDFTGSGGTDLDALLGGIGSLETSGGGGGRSVVGAGGRAGGGGGGIGDLVASLGGAGAVSLKTSAGGAIVGAGRANVSNSGGEAGRSGADVQNVINAGMGAVTNCFEKELKKQPSLRGKLSVQIVINKRGAVRSVKTTSNQLGNQKVATCISSRIKSWKFPPAKGKGSGETTVNQTFVFGS